MHFALSLVSPTTGFGNIIHSFSSIMKDGTACFMLIVENKNSFFTRFSSMGFWPLYTYAQSIAAWGGGSLLANNGLNSLEQWTNNNTSLSIYSPTQISQLGMSAFNFSTMGHFAPGTLNYIGGSIDDAVPSNFKLVITNSGMNAIKELIVFNSPAPVARRNKRLILLGILFAVACIILLVLIILTVYKSLRTGVPVLLEPPLVPRAFNDKIKQWDLINKKIKQRVELNSFENANDAAAIKLEFGGNTSEKIFKDLKRAEKSSLVTEDAIRNINMSQERILEIENLAKTTVPSSTSVATLAAAAADDAIKIKMQDIESSLSKTLKDIRDTRSGAPFAFYPQVKSVESEFALHQAERALNISTKEATERAINLATVSAAAVAADASVSSFKEAANLSVEPFNGIGKQLPDFNAAVETSLAATSLPQTGKDLLLVPSENLKTEAIEAIALAAINSLKTV